MSLSQQWGDWVFLIVIGGIVGGFIFLVLKGMFGKQPEPPMVNVGKCKVRVIFDDINPHEREFVGSTFWSAAFGNFTTTAHERAVDFINDPDPIRVDDDERHIPRYRVSTYLIIDEVDHYTQGVR